MKLSDFKMCIDRNTTGVANLGACFKLVWFVWHHLFIALLDLKMLNQGIKLQTTVLFLPVEKVATTENESHVVWNWNSPLIRSLSFTLPLYFSISLSQVVKSLIPDGQHCCESKESPTTPKWVCFNEVDYKSSSDTHSQDVRHPRLLSSRRLTG